ncbi:MAG: hypothetical protein NVSMB26_22860 [Beijerinckiaceae bacterium]
MIPVNLTFQLPAPWEGQQSYTFSRIGAVMFLVGPNGSGKSRFAEALRSNLANSRLLGTDRMQGMVRNEGMGIWGAPFEHGLDKAYFGNLKGHAANLGFAVDTFVLLEERLGLRLRVEATLSHLFDRNIILEWDSGRLVPKAMLGRTGASYRLDKDECHGIKELLILLTHLYNQDHRYLVIDEPELNLHPQFQSFFMQEVRSTAGDPTSDPAKKAIILITHSPFILDFKSVDDLRSVISFDLKHSLPRSLMGLSAEESVKFATLIPRLNVHHKQFFFSDNPIFVEGTSDTQLISAIQECRGASIAAAGSCIIDAGGCEEVNKYLEICAALDKQAHFLYDLDSLFLGSLRACIRDDGEVSEFLSKLGLGQDFGRYCGELDRLLTDVVRKIEVAAAIAPALADLKTYVDSLAASPPNKSTGKNLARARLAVLIALAKKPAAMAGLIDAKAAIDVEGRLSQIAAALRQKNVHLLTKGALEHHLPSYTSNLYAMSDEAKKAAVQFEIELLAKGMSESALAARYGELIDCIKKMPAKEEVNLDKTLKEYLGDYIHNIQGWFVKAPDIDTDALRKFLSASMRGTECVMELAEFMREGTGFRARIRLLPLGEKPERFVSISHLTNAGMLHFTIEGATR